MKKLGFFVATALFFALMHACSLNNNILVPDCLIFEVEMVDKLWKPVETANKTAENIFFTTDGLIQAESITDSVTFFLNNCNTLHYKNHNTGESNTWQIVDLNPNHLVIKYDAQNTVTYKPSGR